MAILNETCKPVSNQEGLSEEDQENKEYLFDNSIGALFKIYLNQNDGGNLVKTSHLSDTILPALPLKTDLDEAEAVHQLMLTQLLAKNQLLLAFP